MAKDYEEEIAALIRNLQENNENIALQRATRLLADLMNTHAAQHVLLSSIHHELVFMNENLIKIKQEIQEH